MSFLGGWFLLALPLIGVPVVIHMMKKRQRDVIPWGAMQFLREPTRRGQRISQMDRWLLLAARMLILACLIGALAQPLLRWGRSSDADGLPLQLVLIDDTRSTLADNRFSAIRTAAEQFVASLPNATPIEVWAIGTPPRRIIDDTTGENFDNTANSRSQIRAAISDYSPRGGDGNFTTSVRQAVSASINADQQQRENENQTRSSDSPLDVWLFSDDTAAGWKQPVTASTMIPGTQHRLHLMQVGSPVRPSHQFCVASVESSRRAIAKNEAIGLSAAVVNFGSRRSPDVTGLWKHNGKFFAESTVKSLAPSERVTLQTELSIKDPGSHEFTFELKSDGGAASDFMPVDDVGHVVVNVVGELPLLVITDSRDTVGQAPTDADYLSAVLGRNLGGWKSRDRNTSTDDTTKTANWQSLFRPEVHQVDNLKGVNWQRFPAIVWLGGKELPPGALSKLTARVRQGAGLWVTLDAQTDRASINAALGNRGLGIAVDVGRGSGKHDGNVVGRLVVNGSHDQLQRLHPPDPTDAILSALSDTERLDLDLVRIRRRIDLHPPRGEDTSQVLLRTFEGDPIALLSSVGRGRVVLQGLPLNPSWSNFPLSKSFVVWVLQVLDHLSQPVAKNYNLATNHMLRQRVDTIDHEFELTLPNGNKETLIALPQIAGNASTFEEESQNQIAGVVRFDRTDQPGLYRLKDLDDDTNEIIFSVVGDYNESDVFHDSTETLTSLATDSRVNLHPQSAGFDFDKLLSAIPKDDSRGPVGQPLWPALLLGLLIAIALETFLAGYAALRRYGRFQSTDPDSAPSFGIVPRRVSVNQTEKTLAPKETTV
ncbi:BatA domain-containing protein [Rhodopirellula sp. SWK7]|uniref:BatA domain-containing protein n=1 Tax=Rhodopirellula sp. SWK7 TaxID=595460 RepID=UPI0002BFD1D6|nr:BatA domain-containing protein [Rhodopirellula sp. SWK7]EMI40606.1 membrane protein containing DUF1550 [Rhodopirellula sp. SWK7]